MKPPKSLIKRRREAIDLSLQDLASQVGLSKSYLSRVETGERALTDSQAEALGHALGVPPDLLSLESGRLPADVQALVADATEVTTALRATVEQVAVDYPKAPARTFAPKPMPRHLAKSAGSEIPRRIAVTKATTTYRAHSYHTKVPPSAIKPFIMAFTEPGDLVSDPFCGSGMTGVAALDCGRNGLLSDLSPAAVHIARNYTASCDIPAFKAALQRLQTLVEPTMRWLYTPIGAKQAVEYTVWSDVFACNRCKTEIAYWDALRQGRGGGLVCPTCKSPLDKQDLIWRGERPVQTHVAAQGRRRIKHHTPTSADLALIDEVEQTPIPYWVPQLAFGADREMWRSAHTAMGISDAAGFYTRRNLHALAALRHAIVAASPNMRVREALLFAFTACVNRASKRYQWNSKRPTNVMTGTLYISSLRYEWNVWSLFRRKAGDVLRFYESRPPVNCSVDVFQTSATDLSCIPDGAVDMVFMDPPFGSNIFYADSSLLWDAWLGAETDQRGEIVVNQRRGRMLGGKDLGLYGDLMSKAFAESARILRRGGRGVLAFSNTDDRVWEEVQDALSDAGLETCSVHVLDKGQPSIKGVKGQLGKEQVTRLDLTLTLGHRSRPALAKTRAPQSFIDASLKRALHEGNKASDHVYSSVLRDVLQADYSAAGITIASIAARRDEVGRGGTKTKLADFVSGYLSKGDLPVSANPASPSAPPVKRLVPGSRNTAFYSAHSYHTKVPPEAIQPFLEHFTKPGDVVLDPFSGSGMTGVAAAMVGRRAILNDLSAVGAHLAWNHTHPCPPSALRQAFERLEERVRQKLRPLYATRDENGKAANIRWTLWSTRHRCPQCASVFSLWETFDPREGRMARSTICPHCAHKADRRHFDAVDNQPAVVAFQRQNGSLGERAADATDLADAKKIAGSLDDAPFPDVALGPDREMYRRCALHLQGIRSVADMYTPRNRIALSRLWQAIQQESDKRLRRVLAFAFTNTAWHGTRMRRFNARGGHRPLTGTLYVPQLSAEANVLEVMRKKIGQLETYYTALGEVQYKPDVLMGSATELSKIKDGSIDYIFTDPPFGSNIFYADCNLIWEAWLGRVTDATHEAVVNRALTLANGGKSLQVYTDLMTASMCEMARVLKPGGWATVVFHNTDADVWASLSAAARAAGFEFHEAASLDRKQQSHKGYKGRDGAEDVAHFDVVMNLRKVEKPVRPKKGKFNLKALVASALAEPEIAARGVQGVHAEIMRRLVSEGRLNFPAFSEVRALVKVP